MDHYSTHRGQKAAGAERVNRTILERLFRHFRGIGKYRYLDVLPKLVADYNNSMHSVTGMKLIDVNTSNEMFFFNKLNYKTKSNFKSNMKSVIRCAFC